MDRAIERAGGAYLVPLSGGTTHRPPPLDENGFPIFESVAAARYLIDRGFPAQRILTEIASYDTIGNAYFSRVIHVAPRGFRRLLVITSAFHMPRTEAIFRWVYALDDIGFELEFDATPDIGIDAEALAARRKKEMDSLAGVHELAAGIRSMPDLHRWIFTEHAAYAAGAKPQASSARNLLSTY